MDAVTIEGAAKRWPGASEPVFEDVDLRLAPGRLAWVGGENGVGKTTLLRLITNVLEPDAGSVSVCGLHPVRDRREYQRRLALLAAGNAGLYARLTVRQHLDFWTRMTMVPRADRKHLEEKAISDFGLEQLVDRRVDRMSMGQRQRVRIAITFVHEPRLALLDEPRNSLDSAGSELLAAAVGRFKARGGSVIWCSPEGEELGVTPDESYEIVGTKLVAR
jgi:ABC-type multidrug transport system ATPase subunit